MKVPKSSAKTTNDGVTLFRDKRMKINFAPD